MQLNPSRAVKQQKSRLKNSVPCLLTADGFPDLKHGDGWPLSTHESGPPPLLPPPPYPHPHAQAKYQPTYACCKSPGGFSLERLVLAHGPECGGRQHKGGSCGTRRGQAAWRCYSNDDACDFRVNAKYDGGEGLYYITGLREHTCQTRHIKKRRKHRLREYDGTNQQLLEASIAPTMAGGGKGGVARRLQEKMVTETGDKFNLNVIRRELSRATGGSPLEKAMHSFGFLHSDLEKLAKSRPSLAIALETGPLAGQFWDMDESGGWPASEVDDHERRHTFRHIRFLSIACICVLFSP